ncbi:hypothetical protein CCY16_00482 [Wolbachia endosymbiont of Wuchereria bancrofti]|nr:hypothetical protein CCY16_00482 [Wolbachia endosymbiont of Wuchereria bancrofti]
MRPTSPRPHIFSSNLFASIGVNFLKLFGKCSIEFRDHYYLLNICIKPILILKYPSLQKLKIQPIFDSKVQFHAILSTKYSTFNFRITPSTIIQDVFYIVICSFNANIITTIVAACNCTLKPFWQIFCANSLQSFRNCSTVTLIPFCCPKLYLNEVKKTISITNCLPYMEIIRVGATT